MQNFPGGVNVPRTPELLNDFERFKQQLYQRTGLDLNQYKFDQTYRRIWTMVERAGFQRFTDYLQHLLQDEARLRAFIDRLAINVSELFRNPEQFQILEREVLPLLLQRSFSLRLWSAGCSYGAEAYSLAILLHELAPRRPHQILGTDIDQEMLTRAQRGIFQENDMRSVPPTYRERYFRAFTENGRTLYEAIPSCSDTCDSNGTTYSQTPTRRGSTSSLAAMWSSISRKTPKSASSESFTTRSNPVAISSWATPSASSTISKSATRTPMPSTIASPNRLLQSLIT